MRWQMLSRWQKLIGVVVLTIVGWGLLVYAMDWPINKQESQLCEICMASRTVDTFFAIPLPKNVRDSKFSRYYMRYSDTNHRHSWCTVSIVLISREHCIRGSGGLLVPHKMAWDILQSLPKGNAQKDFFEKMRIVHGSSSEADQFKKALWTLCNAYRQDPNRKDWPVQLRKVGLYPKTDIKN